MGAEKALLLEAAVAGKLAAPLRALASANFPCRMPDDRAATDF